MCIAMVERLPGLASARKGSELKGGSLPDSHRWMGVSCFAENILNNNNNNIDNSAAFLLAKPAKFSSPQAGAKLPLSPVSVTFLDTG